MTGGGAWRVTGAIVKGKGFGMDGESVARLKDLVFCKPSLKVLG